MRVFFVTHIMPVPQKVMQNKDDEDDEQPTPPLAAPHTPSQAFSPTPTPGQQGLRHVHQENSIIS